MRIGKNVVDSMAECDKGCQVGVDESLGPVSEILMDVV